MPRPGLADLPNAEPAASPRPGPAALPVALRAVPGNARRAGYVRVLLIASSQQQAEKCLAILDAVPELKFVLDWLPSIADGAEVLNRNRHDLCLLSDRDLNERDVTALLSGIRPDSIAAVVVIMTSLREAFERALIEAGVADVVCEGAHLIDSLQRVIRHAVIRRYTAVQAAQEVEKLRADVGSLMQMRHSNRRLIENASHDFRTPLAVIKEFASIIEEGLAGEVTADQREFLGIILSRVDQLANMIDSILDASRLDSDVASVQRHRFSVKQLIENVRPTLEQHAAAHKVRLNVLYDPTIPDVFCDRDSVGRIIVNLVVNACKAMNKDGNVLVWAAHSGTDKHITIGITDNGRGIARDQVEAIFERFRQIEGDAQSAAEGFGLGLHISSELVRVNFGKMKVQSEPDKGSTFAFTLPVFDLDCLTPLHFDFLRASSRGFRKVSLALAYAQLGKDAAHAVDVERFLSRQIRSYDMMLPLREGAWLLCLASDETELSKVTARILGSHAETNRSRPEGPLPEILLHPAGTWELAFEGDALRRAVDSAVALGSSPSHEVH